MREQRLRALPDAMPTPAHVRHQGVLLYISRKALQGTGFPEAQGIVIRALRDKDITRNHFHTTGS